MRRFLIDSHVYIWLVSDESRIKKDVLVVLRDPESQLFVSMATLWELSAKSIAGKLKFTVNEIVENVEEIGASKLQISDRHILAQTQVEVAHKDPFDRLICAQALTEDLILVTSDSHILASNVHTIRA